MFYSQAGEDKYLFDKYFRGYTSGVFLEMGALDGVLYSNTKFFEDYLNWTGILVEPNPIQFLKLKENRPYAKLYNDLVSDQVDPLQFRYFDTVHAAVSGVESTLPKSHFDIYFDNHPKLAQDVVTLHPKSLTSIIKSSGFECIDLFSLDVEGHELNVLKSYDFSVPIKLILIERLESNNTYSECETILKNNGYLYLEKVAQNSLFIHKNYIKAVLR